MDSMNGMEDRVLVTVHLYYQWAGTKQYIEYYVVPVKDDKLVALLHEKEDFSMTKRHEAVAEWKENGYMFWEGDTDQLGICSAPKGVYVSGFCDMNVDANTQGGTPNFVC